MTKNTSTLGSNHQDIKIRNRSLVLKMVCTGANISRINISRLTGLSKMSITNIVNELISDGYVIEQDSPPEVQETVCSGRKPVYLEPRTDKFFIVGIYISRDYAIATLSNLKCEAVFEQKCSFSFEESDNSFIEKLKGLVKETLSSDFAADKKILAIGIASIGPLDLKNGIILEPPNFHKLKGIPIKQILEEEFELKVYLDNDMNASALAEKLYGKANRLRNFVYVGITNGIGAGIIANDSLFEGDMGFGGEIGHVSINFDGPKCACGNIGCLELYASIPEIVTQARNSISLGMDSALSGLDIIEWKDIIRFAYAGDKLSLNLIDRLCLYISIGLVSLSNIFDPEIIYLGHEIALAGNLVTERLTSSINDKIISNKYKNIPVEISTFGDKAPVAGSSAIVLDKLFNGLI